MQYNYSEDKSYLNIAQTKKGYGYTSLTPFCGECGNHYFCKQDWVQNFICIFWRQSYLNIVQTKKVYGYTSYLCLIFIYIYGRKHKVCHFINWVTLTDYVRLANKDGEMLSQPSQILRHQIIRCISRAIKYFAIGCAHFNSNNLQSTKWTFIVFIRIWYQVIVKLIYDETL